MQELVKVIKNDVFTDSMVIAQGTGNEHHAVRELIKRYKSDIVEFGTLLISNEESTGGRPLELFLLNEPQATFIMTLLRNSKIVVGFKKELVRQFYQMRQYIQEHQSPHWQQTRLESKSNRRMETDEIKQLVEYARGQGSKNADRYYCNLSKLADNAAGIQTGSRDMATVNQLNNIVLIERIIANVIREGMQQRFYYKDIYKACKARIEAFREVAYLGVA